MTKIRNPRRSAESNANEHAHSKTKAELLEEVEELKARLFEAEETLRAIREGEVDAIVVSSQKGEQIFSLVGAESIYRLIVETMKESAFMVTLEGQILYCNAQFSDFIGRPAVEIIGHSLEELVGETEKSSIATLLLSAGQEPVKKRLVFQSPDGSPLPAHISANILSQGEDVSICVVVSDLRDLENSTELIQQLRSQKDELKIRERDLSRAQAHAHVGSWRWDLQQDVVTWSDELYRIFGVNPQTFKPSHSATSLMFHPDDRPRYTELVESALAGKEIRPFESRIIRPGGEQRFVVASGFEVESDQNGNAKALFGTILDISDLKRAEEASRQSRDMMKEILDAAPAGILVSDSKGEILLSNAVVEKILGCRPSGDAHGSRVGYEILTPDGKPVPRGQSPLSEALAGRAVLNRELLVRRSDGGEVSILANATPLSSAGRIQGAISVLQDITKRKLAERALLESEQRFRSVIENMSEGLILFDMEGNLLYQNGASRKIHGFGDQAAGIVKKRDVPQKWEAWDEQERPLKLEEWPINRVVLGQEQFQNQVLRVRYIETGQEFYASYNGSQICDQEGNACFGFVTIRDISDQVYAQAELAARERRLRVFFDSDMVGTIFWNMDGRITGANNKFLQMTGYSREDLDYGRLDWAKMTPSEYLDLDRHAQDELRKTGVDNAYEKEFIRKDGSRIPIIIGAAMLDERRFDGVAFVLDITDRKKAEEDLRQSQERFKIMGEILPYGVWWCNEHGGVEYMSQSFLDLLGMTMEESKEFGWTKRLPPDEVEPMLTRWSHCIRTGEYWDDEHHVLGLDGKYHAVLTRGRPVRDNEGRIVGWAGINLDIDDRKRWEEEIKQARESAEKAKSAAEAANRAKDHFLAVLSHELRTPLTPVMMGISMLQDSPALNPGLRDTVDMVRSNVEMEARLIDDLLDVTRIARGKIELNRTIVDLRTVVNRAVEVCRPDLEARRLEFGVDTNPDAHYSVKGDASRLEQVFWNLLKNAVKFTPHGGCVGIRFRQDGEVVIVEVNDSGIGIEKAALTRVFDAFEQAERSITRQFGGLGLGLAISKAIVELHGGQIQAESEGRGKGATFRIRLPLSAPVQQGKTEARVPYAKSTVRPLHILLVEDHGVTAQMMRTILAEQGHSVEMAADLATALGLAGLQQFDLLLSDLGLPDGSGHDLIRELRARGYTFPGIALSGYGQEEDIRQSYEAGFAAHLTKPASRESVLESVRTVAGKGNGNAPAQPLTNEEGSTVFDPDEALKRCFGNPEMLKQMIGFFDVDSKALLDQIRSAVNKGNAAEVGRAAHRLKGSLVYLAAQPAADATIRLEQAAKSESYADMRTALRELESQLELLKADLSTR